jgi:hemolysin activation/secretion protein
MHVADATDGGVQMRSSHDWTGMSGNSVHVVRADFDALFTREGAKDLVLTGTVANYLALSPSLRLALGMTGATSTRLDRDSPFFLGLATGLRAARFREFAGDRLVRANAELRWVYAPGILDLVTPGLACFLDAGSAWFEADKDFRLETVRGAIGFGLRFGFNRGSEEAPIRLDLGWPLFYDNGRGGAVLSIGTGQVF